MSKELAGLKDSYLRCVRCGQCRSVCPVFKEIRTEAASPRAKVFLAHMLAAGELKASKEAASLLSLCLLCQACTKDCPSAIPVHQIVTAARSLLAEKVPSPFSKLIFGKIWTYPALLNLSAGLLRGCQSTGLMGFGVARGLLPKGFSIPGRLPARPARAFLPETTPADGKLKMRLGYFLGCATNYLYPDVAICTVAVLSRLGCEVVLPRQLKCCGLPQQESGETAAARALAVSNVKVFKEAGIKTVVTDCASCAATIKENPAFEDIELLDLSGLLVDLIAGGKPVLKKIRESVTYHDPCHLAKAQGITDEPRELLRMACADFREMPGAAGCCGGGGIFSICHYDVSMGILKQKISSIKETRAETVATFCPACMMQLHHGLWRHSGKSTVTHPVQLLAQGLGLNVRM